MSGCDLWYRPRDGRLAAFVEDRRKVNLWRNSRSRLGFFTGKNFRTLESPKPGDFGDQENIAVLDADGNGIAEHAPETIGSWICILKQLLAKLSPDWVQTGRDTGKHPFAELENAEAS
jgi:hypothetical protein